MERVAEALQFAVVVEGAGTIPLEPEVLEEIDFLFGGVAAHCRIAKEVPKAGLLTEGRVRFDFPIRISKDCYHISTLKFHSCVSRSRQGILF